MPAQLSHFDVGFATVLACGLVAVWFAAMLQSSSRLSMLGVRPRASAVAVLADPRQLSLLVGAGWLTSRLWIEYAHPGYLPTHPLSPPVVWLGTWATLISVGAWWQRRASRALRFEVSRGETWKSVRMLCGKAGIGSTETTWGVPGFPFYVVPDEFRSWTATPASVCLWRRYLDAMSRTEIDALVARQVTRQNLRYYLLILCPAAAGALAAVALFEFLNVSTRSRLMALPLLLAVEVLLLAISSPEILLRADLRAIRLIGNAEVLLSAVADAARMDGSAPDMPHLEKLARKAGVPLDRLRALIEPRGGAAADRYPTTGDYLTTGLP